MYSIQKIISYIALAGLIITLLVCPAAAVWANDSYLYRTTVSVTTPYHYSLNVSSGAGTNNATYVYCNSRCNADLSDIIFYLDNTTLLPFWIENSTTGKVWINVSSVGSGTVNMYYGFSSAVSMSNFSNTFQFRYSDDFEDGDTSNAGRLWDTASNLTSTSQKYQGSYSMDVVGTNPLTGSLGAITLPRTVSFWLYLTGTAATIEMADADSIGGTRGFYLSFTNTPGRIDYYSGSWANTGITISTNTWTKIEIEQNTTTFRIRKNDGVWSSALANRDGTITDLDSIYFVSTSASHIYTDNWYLRNYTLPEPSFGTWGVQEGFLINSNWNNYTNDNSFNFSLTSSTHIFFNVTNSSSVDFFSWFLNGVNQSKNVNGTGLTISGSGVNNITVIAHNATGITSSLTWFVTIPFVLLTPVNGSLQTSVYPPIDAQVNFSWMSGSEYPAFELIVARDINFNIIDIDIFTSNVYYNTSLDVNHTYYWKVRQYNATSGVYGNTSTTNNFTIVSTTGATGTTGIHGVVYEILSGSQSPINGATVYISNSNSTYSSFQVVGSNGYYLFEGLNANTTYYISARATGYDNSITEYVTTVNGTWTQKDIKLSVCISGQDCFGIKNYVKFIATDFYGNLYPDLSVSVYKGSDVTTTYTGTTGTDGGVSFLLTKDQSYRLVFSGSTITTTTITITPGESTLFYVFVSAATPRKYWDNASYQPVDIIRTGVTTSTIGTTGYVNVTYTDALSQTTSWIIFLNQTNRTNSTAPQITIASQTGSGNASIAFTLLSGFAGESYIVNIKAQHTTFGQVLRSYGVQFYGTKNDELGFIADPLKALIGIMILVFVGSFFDSTNYRQGSALLCGVAWVLLGLGFFTYAGMQTSMIIGLSIASVLAIVSNMTGRNSSEMG